MDDKTPDQNATPDQNPTPGATPDAVPTTPFSSATAGSAPQAAPHTVASEPVAPAAKPGRKRALLIGGGIAAAVLLAGGGVAVGAAIADEFGDDDRPGVEGPRHDDHDDDHGPRDDHRTDDHDHRPAGAHGPVTGIGTDSADELLDIAEAARGAAEGDVTSIDAKRDGTWEVQLTTTAGDETEVRVDEDLTATVVSTDPADGDDTGPALTLDDQTIRALVEAALAEADGMITDLDVDADDVSPYDASVLTTDNRSVDIEFDASFAVVGTDLDD
ncbi:hypothetical protein [Microbacterium sp. p3-SID336]|uniref:hypothetical protein n=1 Tax=Microbacterium sp. p3-SID336 TaxID=2916212 RepID=UPI0021A40A47|nr:hypothetical protein [Microbacterium sp. p3-SID336]MCT1479299.1 hypothetical protein [Microbacterium sp. p3-SID336]